MSEYTSRRWCATGIFLALFGLYVFTAPGRIDITDGQWRYDVARNWLDTGEPVVADPYLLSTHLQLANRATGKSYGFYNAAPSLTPMPLMALSRRLPGHSPQRDQFAFSLTGPLFGALLGALLVLGYGALGVRLRASLLYTAIFCLATLWWPASDTVFDQNQHAVLILATALLGWHAGRRRSICLAALAGMLGGLLLNYQEMYAVLLPALGLAVLASPREGSPRDGATLAPSLDRAAFLRCLAFGLGCCVGLGLFFAFNEIRFGTTIVLAKYGSHHGLVPPTWGNPLAGFLSLAISPGKGIFWFSPPLVLALLGARGFCRRAPALSLSIAGVSVTYLLIIIHLSFFGGDWCWGPRYVIPVMPLWGLAFPFAAPRLRLPRRWIAPLAAVGLLVQMAGVSTDTQRFFHERNLRSYFWALDPWCYFKESQLAARPLEILSSISPGPPKEAVCFSPALNQPSYIPVSPTDSEPGRLWIRHFLVFYLPRPWWGWMGRIVPEERPIDPAALGVACVALLGLGGALLLSACHAASSSFAPRQVDPGPAVSPGGFKLAEK